MAVTPSETTQFAQSLSSSYLAQQASILKTAIQSSPLTSLSSFPNAQQLATLAKPGNVTGGKVPKVAQITPVSVPISNTGNTVSKPVASTPKVSATAGGGVSSTSAPVTGATTAAKPVRKTTATTLAKPAPAPSQPTASVPKTKVSGLTAPSAAIPANGSQVASHNAGGPFQALTYTASGNASHVLPSPGLITVSE